MIDSFCKDDTCITANSDKGIGPVYVETPCYIKDGLVYLADAKMCEIISEEQRRKNITNLKHEFFMSKVWHFRVLSNLVVKYIRKKLDETEEDPFGYFYLPYKLHKTPVTTRPVCSDYASLSHALGQRVDEMIQPIMREQETYIQDSFSFKAEIDKIFLPPNASIFTYDADKIYTNIDTEECIPSISEFPKHPSIYMWFQ